MQIIFGQPKPKNFDSGGERDQIIEEVVNLGSDLDFELNTQNVKQCLQFNERHMSSEDLFEINQPRAFEHEELEDIPENPAEMSYKQLQEIVLKGSKHLLISSESLTTMLKGNLRLPRALRNSSKVTKKKH